MAHLCQREAGSSQLHHDQSLQIKCKTAISCPSSQSPGLGCSSQCARHQRCLSGLLSIHCGPCHWSQAVATSAQVTEGSCVHESCVSLPSCPFQGSSCVVSPMPLLYSSRKEVFSTGSDTLLGVSTEETEGPLHSHIGRSAAPVFIS